MASNSGLGLTVTSEDGAVKVVTPTDDTPAAKAGIKAGDYVTHLDDELIYGGTLNEAVDKMRGPAGTKIKLTIVRQGEPKPLEFTLTREVVVIKPVKWETRGNVGLIRISTFNNKTGEATRCRRRRHQGQAGRRRWLAMSSICGPTPVACSMKPSRCRTCFSMPAKWFRNGAGPRTILIAISPSPVM